MAILNDVFRLKTYLNVVMPADMFDCLVKGKNSFNKISSNLSKSLQLWQAILYQKLNMLFFSLNAHMQGKGKNTLFMATEVSAVNITHFLKIIHKVVGPLPKGKFCSHITLKKIIISYF